MKILITSVDWHTTQAPDSPTAVPEFLTFNNQKILALPCSSQGFTFPDSSQDSVIPSGGLIKTSAKYLFPHSNSPQSNLPNKFIPQRSHLLLPVYSCNRHPQRKRRTLLFNIIPGFNFPAFVKDLFSKTKTLHYHTP